ncbi:MAG: hypothetical protein RSD10_04790 [Anaerovoracaceae bacterium]
MELKIFIKKLKGKRECLTRQEFRTLKGQAIKGDIDGAVRGLDKLVRRNSNGN